MAMILSEISPRAGGADFGKNPFNKSKLILRFPLKAVYKLKFKPAMKDGIPVKFWKPVLIEFRLRKR